MITNVLGNVPVIKVLDFLQRSIPHDFTRSEIEEQADVGYTDLRRNFVELLATKMVLETRVVGGVQLYTLNPDNEIVNAVVAFCNAITAHNGAQKDAPTTEETGDHFTFKLSPADYIEAGEECPITDVIGGKQ